MTQSDSGADMRRDDKTEFLLLREKVGLTRKEAAELLRVSEHTAYRYETGSSKPPKLVLHTLRERARKSEEKPEAFKFAELFAGVGGLRLGFESIGGKCVFTSEWDAYSQKTYKLNFPDDDHEISGDIREFSKKPDLIPEHDVLLAGFPCQPFSIAGVSKKNALGRPHGFLCDTQGTLFFDTAQIIAHHRPAVFLLENVKNLEGHDGGVTFRTIMNVLQNELKYRVQSRVISSEPWVPQKRERIFIVGFRDETAFDFDALKVPPRENGPKLGSILEENVDPKYTLTEHLWKYLQDYKAKHQAKGNGFGYSVFGPNDVTRTLSARYYKDGSEVLIQQPGNRPRRLTPTECARLMGFERGNRKFKIGVSDTQAYRQFGNAVVVPVVEFVAEGLKPHIEIALAKEKTQSTSVDRTKLQPPVRLAVNG